MYSVKRLRLKPVRLRQYINHELLSNHHHELLSFQLSSLILSFLFSNIQIIFTIKCIKTFYLPKRTKGTINVSFGNLVLEAVYIK